MADSTITIKVPAPWRAEGVYSRNPLNISPKGLVYGARTRYANWPHEYWWDGEQYLEITDESLGGTAGSVELLPSGPRAFGEIWKAVRYTDSGQYIWDTYYWDSEAEGFKILNWYFKADALSDLPYPGYHVGAAHIVVEPDVEVFWDGFQFRRPRHSSLDNDEEERHLPRGFLQIAAPDVRVVYVGPTEIGLQIVPGGSGRVWVNGEWITASATCSVRNNLAVINWDSQHNRLTFTHIQPDTEYWIYLANNQDPAFSSIAGIAADDTHNAAPPWNYQGRMFLSATPNVDGYLSPMGSGKHARMVGRCQTDDTAKADGGPRFIHELGISLISQTANFAETYREYSAYQLRFVDQDTLSLTLIDGLYPQIGINRDLYYLGADYEIGTADAWVDWNDGDVLRSATALSPDTLYFAYLSARIDNFNFNAINPATNRPWLSTDYQSESHYDTDLDVRLRPFLSPKTPEHGRMADAWPGYEVRHIGQIRTDANGKFVPAADVSAIRQPTLNPSDFSGLAEIDITPVNDEEVRVSKRRGASGIVNVAGQSVQTFDSNDANVHKLLTSQYVQTYHEDRPDEPLEATEPAWFTSWQKALGDNVEASTYSIRQVIKAGTATLSGGKIRVTFAAGASVGLICAHASIVERDGETDDGTTTPTEIVFDEESGFEIGAAQSITGDALVYDYDDTVDHLVILDCDTPSKVGANYGPPIDGFYYRIGVTSWNSQTVSGFSYVNYADIGVAKIEVEAASGPISAYIGQRVNIYLANAWDFWGAWANRLVACAQEPVNGYLSRNWPGNNARWIMTVRPDRTGALTGSFVLESIAPFVVRIDDAVSSLTSTYSSACIDGKVDRVYQLISAASAWGQEKLNGLAARMTRTNAGTVLFAPMNTEDLTVTFPDVSVSVLPANGLSLDVSGTGYTIYYVYLRRISDTVCELVASADAPTDGAENLQWKDNDILVGYYGVNNSGEMPGYWSAYSFFNQDARALLKALSITPGHVVYFDQHDAVLVPPIHPATFSVTGSTGWNFTCGSVNCTAVASSTPGYGTCELGYASRNKSHSANIAAGVYPASTFYMWSDGGWLITCTSTPMGGAVYWINGNMILSIEGN